MIGGYTTYAVPAAIVRSITLDGDFRATFTFSYPGELTRVYLYVTTTAMDWYAMGYQPGNLGTWKDDNPLPGSVSPTLDPAHEFTMEIKREGALFTIVLSDTTTGDVWTSTSTDDSYNDFTAIHLKAGYYESAVQTIAIDDFVLQTR